MKDFQHEQLFTELTPAEAAIIEGGLSVINSTIDFDFSLRSRNFAVTKTDPGVALAIGRLTKGGDDGRFVATLKKDVFGPDPTISSATVFSNSSVSFGKQAEGNYYIQFTDKKDGKNVTGPIAIAVD